MKRAVLSLSVAGVTLVACAHDPARHLTPTGVAPRVAVDVEVRNVYRTEHVGTATERDKNGNVVGTTDLTQTRSVGRERYVAGFQLMRGEDAIDERDYYHLAGDDKAAAQLDAYRHRGVIYNRIGLGLAAVGAVGLVAMVAGDGAIKKAGSTAFVIGIPVGSIMALMGHNRMKGNHLPLERALSASGQQMPVLGAMR
jgi:hypothetical protein